MKKVQKVSRMSRINFLAGLCNMSYGEFSQRLFFNNTRLQIIDILKKSKKCNLDDYSDILFPKKV